MINEANMSVCEDLVQILYESYEKILRVNLMDGSHEDIKFNKDEEYELYAGTISQWFYNCISSGMIHKDDVKAFTEFTNLNKLKDMFDSDRNHGSFKYRKYINGQYNWVAMDLFKGREYSASNPVIILCVKNMNDEYLDQLDTNIHLMDGAVSSYRINVTNNVCIRTSGSILAEDEQLPSEGTIEIFTDAMMPHLSGDTERAEYRSIFNKEALIDAFNKGSRIVSMEYAYARNDGNRFYARTCVEMVQDAASGNIKAVLYVIDITDEYVNKTLPKLLYEHEYETVAIIDTAVRTVTFRKTAGRGNEDLCGKVFDYDRDMNSVAGRVFKGNELNAFQNKADLNKIIINLKEHEAYSFTIHHTDRDGIRWLKKYKYIYMDKYKRIILATVEDVTSITEHDVLTGGINRRGFVREAARYLKNSPADEKYSLLFFDLKGIKAINELLGTDGGDEILRFVYAHIKNSRLKPIVLSRTTADHYACLVKTENIDYDSLIPLCQCRYCYRGKLLELYIRCGIYHIADTSMSVVSILDRAKLAKENIQDEYVMPYMVFDTTMKERYVDKSELIYELKEALSNGEFKVYYQPIYDPHTGKVASAEALIRWIHPERGVVSPGLFIPALEESGHISQVDLFVQQTVKHFVEDRHVKGKKNVPISVNLSWMDFYDKQMMDSIITDVRSAKENSKYMRFEVTETSYAALVENHAGPIYKLKDMGAKILLDDFGSGFSSFSTIRDYDFDIIKLDMGFVQQIKNNDKVDSIIHSIIDMAHHVNAKVVAEGAETQTQVDFLKRHGCDYIQGYFFSRPLPQEEFEMLLEEAEM